MTMTKTLKDAFLQHAAHVIFISVYVKLAGLTGLTSHIQQTLKMSVKCHVNRLTCPMGIKKFQIFTLQGVDKVVQSTLIFPNLLELCRSCLDNEFSNNCMGSNDH